MKMGTRLILGAFLMGIFLLISPGKAQLVNEEALELQLFRTKLVQARDAYLKRQMQEAAQYYRDAEALLAQIKDGKPSDELKAMLDVYGRSIDLFKTQLKNRGIDLDAPVEMEVASETPAMPARNPSDGISFVGEIAPILAQHCGGCHMGNARKGGFSMATWQAFRNGIGGAPVIDPGMAQVSYLVEIMEDGSMPPGNRRVPASEIAKIAAWINEGAKFDGMSERDPLNAPPRSMSTPSMAVAEASSDDKVLFSRDIAPVLEARCTNCHGTDNDGGLRVNTFAAMMRGGASGDLFKPGNPQGSLLIQKLNGTASDGQRMPLNQEPLSDAVMQKFITWIQEGAPYDQENRNLTVARVAALYRARTMSHEDLSLERIALAERNWRLGNPDSEPERVENNHFLVMGNVNQEQLQEVLDVAESQHQRLAGMLNHPSSDPLIKGRLTFFLFQRRFQYSEFGQMVERREVPRSIDSHWDYSVTDAYACLDPPEEGEDSLQRMIAEVIAGTYVESVGDVPAWFSQGVARAMSAKIDGRSPVFATWKREIPAILSRSDAVGLVEGKMKLDDSPIIAYGFAKDVLMRSNSQFQTMLNALRSGQPFPEAFQQTYRSTPANLLQAWERSASRG
ncbi:Hypothetical protein PBC10988_40700 [Planctomycetales bacterium 10988]|nr:Hypothetical protein PBC10988_40700 [Planctomycetales bacterium 10988]